MSVNALFAIVEQNGGLRVASFKVTKNLIRRTGPSLPDVYVFHADQPTSSMRLRMEIAGKSPY